MGSYDGAETCELVGTYILSEITKIIPRENIGLYRDDGLAIINKPPAIAERIKKKLCEKFKEFDLKITASANSTVTDFLDVTFDLKKQEYKPYTKPGNTLLYVHTESNHPPIITKRIPQSIENRLSNISSNREIFNTAKPQYEKALYDAGHRTKLIYKPTRNNHRETTVNKRKRNITWYNPPYSMNVKTNIGKTLLALIDRHFPKDNSLHKICNRNTIKISYSCTPNMENIIKSHNSNIINSTTAQEPDRCNCRNRSNCPLPGKCTIKNVIYKATVSTSENKKHYIGLTSNTFKTRYSLHKTSFTNKDKRNNTELSKYIWKLKDNNTAYQIEWKILKIAKPYTPASKKCNSCLWGKYYIITADRTNTLNSRSELTSSCRHKSKFLLSDYG